MKPRKTGQYVAGKVPSSMKKYIENSVSNGLYISVSDFIRAAIKEKLQREGYFNKGNAKVEVH
jgi:Arc/MetJ-type ribon-helix-helix transcriptional regulator